MRKNFLAPLLALLFMFSLFPTAVSAYSSESIPVYVDNCIISGVHAYLDDDYEIRLSSSRDLLKIFPEELKDSVIAYNPDEGIIVKKYIEDLGYSYLLRDYVLYIYKSDKVGHPPLFSSNYSSYGIEEQYTVSGILYPFFDFATGTVIYPFPTYYPNTNWVNTPVKVVVDGEVIDFPDQNPILVDGQVMIPLEIIGELLNCDVSWDSEDHCTFLTDGYSNVYVWPGNTEYLIDSDSYEMDIAPIRFNDVTLVSVRFLTDIFAYNVSFKSNDILTITFDSNF